MWKVNYGTNRTDVSQMCPFFFFFFPVLSNTAEQVLWVFLRLKYSEINNKMKGTRKSTEHVQFMWAILIWCKMLA